MTEHLKISAKIPRKRYVANGSQTVFSFDFVLFQPSELLVAVDGVLIASGVAVSLLADGTGTATFAFAPAVGAIVVLQRHVTIRRETDFQEGGELRAKTLNDEFDFQTAALQQVEAAAARALQLPIDDADNAATVLPMAAVRATKVLAFDANGDPVLSSQTLAQIEGGATAAAELATSAASSATAAASAAIAAQNLATNAANSATSAAASAASVALPLSLASGGTGATMAAAARTNLGLGSAATLNAGSAPNQLPQLDSLGRLPAVDGSLLTNIAGASTQVTAGEVLAIRDLIYQDIFNQRGGGSDRWYRVDTDAIAPVRISPRIGFALAALANGASGAAQVRSGRVAGFSGLAVGQPIFASAVAGAVTQIAPMLPASGTQNATRLVGIAASATEIDFDPDDDTVFVARNSELASGAFISVQHWVDAGAAERLALAYLSGSLAQATGTFGLATVSNRSINGEHGQSLGFQFSATTTGSLLSTRISVFSVTTSGSWEARLYSNSVGRPATQIGASSGVVSINAAGDVTFTFAIPPLIVTGTVYWLVITPISGSPDIASATVADQIGYGSGRSNAIVALADNSIGLLEDWKIEIIQIGGAIRNEPEPLFPELRFMTATDKVTCRFDDGTTSSADTRTTFFNRTSMTRDLVVEVIL
ncbi:MAG: hypothetical protein ING44_13785 [Telmatospirillum sp.]|nr:hypothetical protein [Telmatospirillum sp.]